MLIQNNVKTMSGSKVLINTLKSIGVDTIFGYPGGIVLDLYDELYNQTGIKHILVRHEQSAVHAAEGYSRVSGKCGVVLVTSGPGATNTVSGIVNAFMDGFPLIVLTGQVEKDLIGKNAFQEANICEITKTCTKATFQITDSKDIQSTIIKAYNIATSGKKGPVVVDLAKNIFKQNTVYSNEVKLAITEKIKNDKLDIKNILKTLEKANRPVIVAGGGVHHSNCYDELSIFAKSNSIPVVSTMMGLGGIESKNTNYIGMIGIFGDNSANELLKQSDLIISLGARFNDRITCMFKNNELDNKIFQIDINPDEISTFVKAKDYLICDIKHFLSEINSCSNDLFKDKFTNWLSSAQELKSNDVKPKRSTNMLHSFEIMQTLQKYTQDKDVIFVSEVGQHQISAVKNLLFAPNRRILVSGGSGTMGFGLPASIGASIACHQKTVICISGDGSMQMSLGELALCRDYGLNIKIIILNNGYLGMVRQIQEKNFGKRYSQTKISNPVFTEIAHSYGISALKVNNANDVEEAFKKAFSTNETFIIDFEIEPMETL